MQAVQKRFGDQVPIIVVDRSAEPAMEAIVRDLDFLDTIPYTENREGLIERFTTRLDQRYSAGEISEAIYLSFRGEASSGGQGRTGEHAEEPP